MGGHVGLILWRDAESLDVYERTKLSKDNSNSKKVLTDLFMHLMCLLLVMTFNEEPVLLVWAAHM